MLYLKILYGFASELNFQELYGKRRKIIDIEVNS